MGICITRLKNCQHILKNAVLRKPERTFKNGFQFHTHSAKGNILNEKKTNVKKCVFYQKSQISEISPKCVLDIKVSPF